MSDSRQKVDKINPPEYDENNFWRKLNKNALKAGKDVIEKVLTLYYAIQSEDVSVWTKTIIFSFLAYSLAYFIFPLGSIPKLDSMDSLVVAIAFVSVEMNVTPEHEEAAKKKLQQWFGNNEA
ncbi:MAG: hypothetical protein HC836_04620 [Richelia sp. RM2_1_2]|nr:hypothetical protein [Richelia sp. SM2_1_7]NJM18100.1 hypothetical protein [Richelia sp. SM1_7_0]NJN10791.1 hypothetical protein [Richelia sp. RM1_1_1]NJO27355.1 hypothetical protein [Richelia sp. SL_2_1]NJO57668.1 hypothetical protein [Richelia sp. RM2_1_2]